MFRNIALPLYLLSALGSSAAAQTENWLEVRAPHFLIVTDSSEKEARRTAHPMRSVFQRVFPNADLDNAQPILVLAVQDRKGMAALEPAVYLAQGQGNLVGLFAGASERNYILILLNAPGVNPYAPIYHEYAHFVFSLNKEWLPVWLSEGIAEFYQNTEILDDRVRLGKTDPYISSILERNQLLPLATLLAVDHHSPYYHEQDKGSIFYAESWALTHYLKDKDDLEGTHRLADYIDLVQSKDSVAAATQLFGDLTQLQQDLKKYIQTLSYATSEISGATEVNDEAFVVQALGRPEADTLRAEFLAHVGRENDARTMLTGVLHDDPLNAAANEMMGYAAFRQEKYDESRKWCQESIKLDPQRFINHFCFALASIKKGVPDKGSQDALVEHLRTSIKLNPSFTPAYDTLAIFYAERGANLAEAHDLIEKAVQLAPGAPEVRIDEAQVLWSMRKSKEAMEVLDIALKMSHTPEQTAAVETVMQNLQQYDAARSKQRGPVVLHSSHGGSSAGPAGQTGTQPAGSSAAITDARAIYAPEVEYTEAAREAKLEGVCVVSFIVGVDGKPSNIVVTKKLGMGLDEEAVATVKKWRFEPGRRYGRPVITHMTLKMEFKLFGQNTQRFFDLSEKAKSGDAAAEFELANAFFEGRDVAKDESQGMALLERAARDGLSEAQLQMGARIYGDGNNPGNYVTAYVWYALAQRSGAPQADDKVSELEARMTPDQLSEARQALENWHASPTK